MPISSVVKQPFDLGNKLRKLYEESLSSSTKQNIDDILNSLDYIPQLAVVPMAARSPKLLQKMMKRFGNIEKIPVTRAQRELFLEEVHPGRGAFFFEPGHYRGEGSLYQNFSPTAKEGGPNVLKTFIEPKNPMIVTHTRFSALEDALSKVLGNKKATKLIYELDKISPTRHTKQELSRLTGLNNKQISQVLAHREKSSQVLKERLASEILKKFGYDTVIGTRKGQALYDTAERLTEVIKLR